MFRQEVEKIVLPKHFSWARMARASSSQPLVHLSVLFFILRAHCCIFQQRSSGHIGLRMQVQPTTWKGTARPMIWDNLITCYFCQCVLYCDYAACLRFYTSTEDLL